MSTAALRSRVTYAPRILVAAAQTDDSAHWEWVNDQLERDIVETAELNPKTHSAAFMDAARANGNVYVQPPAGETLTRPSERDPCGPVIERTSDEVGTRAELLSNVTVTASVPAGRLATSRGWSTAVTDTNGLLAVRSGPISILYPLLRTWGAKPILKVL